MSDNSNRKPEGTPKWMKRLVRARMAETGENYTKALRVVKAEHERRQSGGNPNYE